MDDNVWQQPTAPIQTVVATPPPKRDLLGHFSTALMGGDSKAARVRCCVWTAGALVVLLFLLVSSILNLSKRRVGLNWAVIVIITLSIFGTGAYAVSCVRDHKASTSTVSSV